MTVWDFLDKLFTQHVPLIGARLDTITEKLSRLENQLANLEAKMSSVEEKIQEFATQVNDFTNLEAEALGKITQQIQDMKDALVNATTPEKVAEILQPALDNLGVVKDALVALAANGEAVVPPPPDDEPL